MTQEKASNKIVLIIGILALLSAIGLLYLVYETWVIFGFWRLAMTGLINILASVIFIQLMGSGKTEKEAVITYNPKEWPKFLGILVFYTNNQIILLMFLKKQKKIYNLILSQK